MEELESKGKVMRGYSAILPQDIDENLAKALKIKTTEGSLVGDVTPDGPTDKAEIMGGAIITEFNGKKLKNSTYLRTMVAQAEPCPSVKITLIRDGREMGVTIVIGVQSKERSEVEQKEQRTEKQTSKKLGLAIQNLTSDIAQ